MSSDGPGSLLQKMKRTVRRSVRIVLDCLFCWPLEWMVRLKLDDLADHLLTHATNRVGEVRKGRICQQQDALLPKLYSKDSKRLIVFLMPSTTLGKSFIGGGTLSIVSLCEEAARLKAIHQADVIMCTFPGYPPLVKCDWFENNRWIFRFEQLRPYFQNVDWLMLHIPEFVADKVADTISPEDQKWLSGMSTFHINILNQNIKMMPPIEKLASLRALATKMTVTTAHKKYCNSSERERFGVPLHHFSSAKSKYDFRTYPRKENLLIYSPDLHPMKDRVLQELAAVPDLELVEIRNMSYEKFKETIGRAKWALTFGEGLDGYFAESINSGAVSFAVYNTEFFTPDYEPLQTLYPSYQSMVERIAKDIQRLDNARDYTAYQKEQYDVLGKNYQNDEYLENIAKFYRDEYTYP